MFNFNFNVLENEECIKEYFRQNGLVFSWHTIWNKIYSMDIWKNAREHYNKITNRLIMTEDFAFSTVLFYYAKKITKVENDAIFYCQHDSSSTSIQDLKYSKCLNNIKDLLTSFNFVEEFLKDVKIYDKYKDNFYNWKHLYSLQHRYQINEAKKIGKSEKKELLEKLDLFCDNKDEIDNHGFFSLIETKWDEELEMVKRLILDETIKCVSFDVFDTLIVRPLYKPSDLFIFLDDKFRKENNSDTGINFSKIRVIAEQITRDNQFKTDSEIQEITLDDIYDTIHKLYDIPKKILNVLKEEEINLEFRFCKKRSTAYELYTLARDAGKKVICTSDMYLSKTIIEKILKNNGYEDIECLFLSSDLKKTKWSGDLYRFVVDKFGYDYSEILHIGDNRESDYLKPLSLGMNAIHFVKPIEVMEDVTRTNNLSKMLNTSLPFWFDNKESLQFLGIRTMMAMVANNYFDNPYRSFNKDTDFNADPYLIGYYALGMYTYGSTKWLIDNVKGKYEKIAFMARDGYLTMSAYKIISKLYKDVPKTDYFYVSRKSLIPVIINSKLDFYKLSEIIEIHRHSPKSILKYIISLLSLDEDKYKALCKNEGIAYSKKFKSVENFNKCMKIIVDNFFDEEKFLDKKKNLVNYLKDILSDKTAVFDVGYSGRPEFYLSKLLGYPIDTFFLNINREDAIEYADMANYKLNTFFPAKPTATGNAYELLISKLAPSCIGYEYSTNNVVPIFEEYKEEYQINYVIEIIQSAALEFVSDIVDTFGSDINRLYFQNYYVSLPILAYFNASRRLDKLPLFAVSFEDDIRTGESRRMIDDMQEDLNRKNQALLPGLVSGYIGDGDIGPIKVGELYYNPYVNLNKKGKLRRLLYYVLYDRATLKRRFSDMKSKFGKKRDN